MIKWIVPKIEARMAHLIGVDQGMVELGPIEEGFMKDKNIGGSRKRTIIGSSTRNNRDIE